MKFNRVANSHDLAEELFDFELALIDKAIVRRQSHLRSVDELDMKDMAPKQRKTCPTKKRKFKDKLQADRVLHFIINDRNRAFELGKEYRFKQFRSYRCPCGSWHHSSKPELLAEAVSSVA